MFIVIVMEVDWSKGKNLLNVLLVKEQDRYFLLLLLFVYPFF